MTNPIPNLIRAEVPHPLAQPAAALIKQLALEGVYLGMDGPPDALRQALGSAALTDLLAALPEADRSALIETSAIRTGHGLQPPLENASTYWACLPIRLEEQRTAAVLITRPHPFPLEEVGEPLLPMLYLLTAWIERNLYRGLTSRYRASLEALHTVSSNLSTTLDLQGVLAILLEAIANIIPDSVPQIYTSQLDSKFGPEYVFSGGVGLLSETASAEDSPAPEELVQQIARYRWPMLVEDFSSHPLAQAVKAAGWDIASLAGYQLTRGGRLLGVLLLAFRQPRRLSGDERYLLSLLTDQAVLAIDNARVARHLNFRLEEVKALQRLAQSINANQDLNSVLQNTVNVMQTLFDAKAVSMMLLEEDGSLHQAAVAGDINSLPDPPYLTPGMGMAGRALLSRGSILIEDTRRLVTTTLPPPGIRSILVAPLIAQDQAVGTICMVSTRPHAFSAESERLVTIATAQASAAYQNTRLYQEETRRNDELLLLTDDISHEMGTPLTLMKSYLDVLQNDAGGLNDEQHQVITILQSQVTTLSKLANNIILLQAKGSDWLKMDVIDLHKIAEAAILMAEHLAVGRGINIRLQAGPNFPKVPADSERIRQALDNLLHHAIKSAYPQSEITLHIQQLAGAVKISLTSRDDALLSDDELGSDRPAPTKPAGSSRLGINMAIVRRIVEAHGGKIWVEKPDMYADSAEAVYHQVSFTLPCLACSDDSESEN